MRRIALLLIVLVMLGSIGCQSKGSAVQGPDSSVKSGENAEYFRQIASADAAFDDLDDTMSSSPSLQTPSQPQASGTPSYDRQVSASEVAQNELDCEVNSMSCSSGDIITSAPISIQAPVQSPLVTPAPVPQVTQPYEPDKPRPANRQPIIIGERMPGSSSLVPTSIVTAPVSKYPMINGYPSWFSQPGYDGYLGGVGIAKPQTGGYPVQKTVAIALAQADLTRSVEVNVYNEAVSERHLVDTNVAKSYQEKFSTMSRQDAQNYIDNPVVNDEWLNEKTGDLYIWVVLPK